MSTRAVDDPPTARHGLSEAEVTARLARDGPNVLPEPPRRSALVELGSQLVHFFAIMLWVAAGLAWLADLTPLAVAIAAVVVLNAVFAFVQERRADHAAERLRVLLPTRVGVRREGHVVTIEARDVVRDDALMLTAGDRIPADGEVVAAESLMVDTSLLTGESGSVPVEPGVQVWAGTFVVAGEGEAIVTATGRATRLARIAALTTATPKPVTPLTLGLARVVRTVAAISLAVGGGFFVLAWLLGRGFDDGLVFAIGVTVALVPEALLPTVTLSLAWGAEQMAARHVLVRSLEAVETLGSTTYICTDKTGTLTRNEMTVVEAWTPLGTASVSGLGYGPSGAVEISHPPARDAVVRLAGAGVAASTGFAAEHDGVWTANGEPMDAAIDAFARRLGVATEPIRDRCDGAVRLPFDSRRRTAAVVVDGEVVVKGAPDLVLPVCSRSAASDLEAAESTVARLAERGLRVLAIAGRPWEGGAAVTADDRDDVERELELYGLVALEDPPREGVSEALAACQHAGIRVAMLTGDHPTTAAAIAARVGLLGPDHVVVIGDELPSDDDALGELLDHDGVVIARVTPEDKLRIARALRKRGHVVAMTGDGVNDAPALHEADIGVAMGRSGTDVAREAADLVLLDDHFASIVGGVELGRATFVNVRRFLTYHLTDNVAELTPFVVWALSGGSFPLALGVLQILALDLGTDTLSAVALGAEPPGRHVLDRPPVSGNLLDRTVARRAFGLLGPVIAALSMAAFLLSLVASGWWPGEAFPTGHTLAIASGAAYMTVVLGQTANSFACRSTSRTPRQLGWLSNRFLPPAAAIGVAFAVVMITVPALADELDHGVPSLTGWAVAVASMPIVLAVDAFDKHRRRAAPLADRTNDPGTSAPGVGTIG